MLSEKTKPDSDASLRRILHPLVEKWFFSKFKGFSEPQKHGIMEVHSRKNVLITAPTGGTKTLTAFLSILNELIDASLKGILENRVYAVYISPLKALSNDIEKNLLEPLAEMEKIHGKPLGINVQVRTGDTSASKKSKMLKKTPHIFITTPESLAIVLNAPKFKQKLESVEWCIIDEIHSLAENKRGSHLSLSMERLERMAGGMSRVGLSATIAPIEEIAKFLVGYKDGKLRDCTIVNVQFLKKKDFKVLCPVKDLVESLYSKKHKALYKMLHDLIQEHKTTLIFTNTRAGTERVVHFLKEFYPKSYLENIGAHHGSLSKDHRKKIEDELKEGKLKVAVSSTSLELGIDIGFIDLVICLGSPKSVARFLQRAGRAGHQLHEVVKCRMIVLDRDDLVECSVLLKAAIEGEIDRIRIPHKPLDVLSQHIFGISINQQMRIDELLALVKQSYVYHDLTRAELMGIVRYLAGEYTSLETRHVYGKIRYYEDTDMIGRRGKMARVIYMTNIGTIPSQTGISVKIKELIIGKIDEGFLEKLHRGDVFVLGGNTYRFLFARGQTAQVQAAHQALPTVPRWVSEMLPLSFDLAQKISKFRSLMADLLEENTSKKDAIKFIHSYLYVDDNSAKSIYGYFLEQYLYANIPKQNEILIERISEEDEKYTVVHFLKGRRVNDALSRGIGFMVSKMEGANVHIQITDNGFLLKGKKHLNVKKAFDMLLSEKFELLMKTAIENSEILRRRFRHVAARSLMILESYKGHKKRVGRQQVSSMILLKAVKRVSNKFPLLEEARREVLEDVMDLSHAQKIVSDIDKGKIKIRYIETDVPTPFAFNIATQGHADIMSVEDKTEFLRRMHQIVIAKIGQKHSRARELL